MLGNEKYMGHVLTQKTYVIDPLKHRKVKNKDLCVQQYYIRDHHEASEEEEVYHHVQMLMAMKDCHRGIRQFPYFGLLLCPFCGAAMIRLKLPKNNHSYAWTCGGAGESGLRKNRSKCPVFYVMEEYIQEGIRAAFATLSLKERMTYQLFGKQALNYWKVRHLIQAISFRGWETMRVEWRKGGYAEVELHYKKHSDYPRTKIEKIGDQYVLNGELVKDNNPKLQVKSIRNCQKAVRNTLILNPEINEAPVPKVKMTGEFGPE